MISRENLNRIITQAQKDFPKECCGLMAGTQTEQGIEIKEIFEMANMDQSSEHFTMDPKEQFAVVKKVRAAGMKILGNYHSHPYTPSRPSEEDKRLAYDPSLIYGILSLAEEVPVLNFFQIVQNEPIQKLEYTII